jgi:hypothetical protein
MFFRSFVLIRWKQLSSVPKTEISFFVSKNLNKNSKTRRRRRKKKATNISSAFLFMEKNSGRNRKRT